MNFSEAFSVSADGQSWFDPVLSLDTPVFVDPFLVPYSATAELAGGFDRIVDHFASLYLALAANPTASIAPYLDFPEVEQTCLGLANTGIKGSGSGRGLGNKMEEAMGIAIAAGLENPRHFEELGLLVERIGPDRISDIATRLLLPQLCQYTESVASDLGVPISGVRLWTYSMRSNRPTRLPVEARIPLNPRTHDPVVLVPEDILRPLPTINRYAFRDYLWDVHSEQLREEFNIAVKRELGGAILEIARDHPHWVRDFVQARERDGPRPYDFKADRLGLINSYRAGREYARASAPLRAEIASPAQMLEFMSQLVSQFKSFVEQRGWELLWDQPRTKHLPEGTAQRLFQGMAEIACEASDVVMAPESNAGNGPVDFVFAAGFKAKVLLELKHVDNAAYWSGPRAQLTTYMKDHGAKIGMFVSIAYTQKDLRSPRVTGLAAEISRVARETGFLLASDVVAALPEATPASKRR